jgi:two-component system sensor histidine kinase ChiS
MIFFTGFFAGFVVAVVFFLIKKRWVGSKKRSEGAETVLPEYETIGGADDEASAAVIKAITSGNSGQEPVQPVMVQPVILEEPPEFRKFNPFVPQAFLQILKKDSVNQLCLGDHVMQEMTIFFSDIRQFTSLLESLTPEESFKFINSYLSRIVPVISSNGGFVDKYIGDAIMALYPQQNGADMAVRSAVEIQKTLQEYNQHRAKMRYKPLSIGIGIHTGTLMMGVVGVEDRMQNTVISDAVNQASRLESMCKVFNVSIVISDEIFKKLENPGSYMYRYLGKTKVKGKAEPVSVFEIFDGLDPDLLERKQKANRYWEEGMLSYSKKDYATALRNFRNVREILPEDGAAYYYTDYCMKKL